MVGVLLSMVWLEYLYIYGLTMDTPTLSIYGLTGSTTRPRLGDLDFPQTSNCHDTKSDYFFVTYMNM